MDERKTGVVKWFDPAKGYGFIESEEGNDIFVHFRAINIDGFRTLKYGQQVAYTLVDGPKGPLAENVDIV